MRAEGLRPILLHGPTASGKSALALAIAEQTGAVIINADALQVYRDWRVLSARPSAAEENRAPHRLYGHVDAADPDYSVGRWLREAGAELDAAEAEGRPAIVIGGTGLYFAALTRGLAEIPPVPAETRAAIEARIDRHGLEVAVADLARRDPETAERIDRQNPRRVLRALEVLEATGRGLAAWGARTPPPRLPPENAARWALSPDADALARRIATRFAAMVEAGALDEVRAVRARALDLGLPAMRAHGRAALTRYLDGESTLAAAIEDATIETRQYAKRQRTWARNQFPDWHRIAAEEGFAFSTFEIEALLSTAREQA